MIDTSNKNPASREEAKPSQTEKVVENNGVWKVFTIVSVGWIIIHASSVIRYQLEARRLNLPVNQLSDLWMMICALIVITLMRIFVTHLTSDRIRKRQILVDPLAGEVKIDKSIRAFVGIVWYVFCIVKYSYSRVMAITSSQDMTIYLRCFLEDANVMN